MGQINTDGKVLKEGFNKLKLFINTVLRHEKGFKFYLKMQEISIKYIINNFSNNFVIPKPYSTEKCKKFLKDFFLANFTSELFPVLELKFSTSKGKKKFFFHI